MYSIIGGDGKTYGPVSLDELGRWVKEGRADSHSKVREDGSNEWRELGTLKELFPHQESMPPKLVDLTLGSSLLAQPTLRPMACLARAWQAYRLDPWRTTGIILLVFLAQFLVNNIPVAGLVIAFVFNGPILGGVYAFCLQTLHGHKSGIPDISGTLKARFLPCFLATTVSNFLALGPLLLGMIPALAIFQASGVPMEKLMEHPGLILGISLPVLGGFLAMMYLLFTWSFAVPIVACSSTDFWEGMKLSWRGVRANFFPYLGFLLLLGLLNLVGLLCLGVGILVTLPLTFLSTMAAYEQIFLSSTSHSR